MDQIPEPMHQASSIPPWKKKSIPTIITSIPGITDKESQPDLVRKNISMDHIETHYKPDSWTRAYTDGSAEEALKNGGAGVYINYERRETKLAFATVQYSNKTRPLAKTKRVHLNLKWHLIFQKCNPSLWGARSEDYCESITLCNIFLVRILGNPGLLHRS